METEVESERCAAASPRTTLGQKGQTTCRGRHVEDSFRCPRDVVSFQTPLGALGTLYPFLVARCLEDRDIAPRTKFRGELTERSQVLGFMDRDSKLVVGSADL